MRKYAILALITLTGFAISLLARGEHAYAQRHPLLTENFWTFATVEQVDTATMNRRNVHISNRYGVTLLHFAVKANGNPRVIKLLLDRGADIHARDRFGGTVLQHATEANGNPEVIGLLLDRGADIQARDPHGSTALHGAAGYNPIPEVVELLLDRGADASAKDNYGKTPFDYAEENGNLKNSKVYRRLRDLQYQ